uniref:IP05617p n=1 Tax=Drosophila melanogaster TaxID=7227 RepID=Q4V648_DROME|nr:IP05617p [Drosophila melanogaster]AAY54874.1 IP05917p [Drosophila melanogaster]
MSCYRERRLAVTICNHYGRSPRSEKECATGTTICIGINDNLFFL